MIFLDHASTTPMSQTALAVYHETASRFYGNTASLHEGGYGASQIYEASKKAVAGALGADPSEVYFTGGGTEANDRAIRSLTAPYKGKDKHVITTKIEHPSVLSSVELLKENGFSVTFLDVDKDGRVPLSVVIEAIQEDTVLVSIQHGNSEIGTIQDIKEISHICHAKGVLFHTDAVQTFGKVPIDVKELNVDALSVSAHKLYGPKGVGAVYIKEGVNWQELDYFTSPSHERGFRPGTANTPGIAAFAKAVLDCDPVKAEDELHRLREFFIKCLKARVPNAVIEGHNTSVCPHIAGFRLPGIEGQYIMLTLDRYGICVSTGSACQVAKQEASHVLSSIGKSEQESREFVRLSVGLSTSKEDLIRAVEVISTITKRTEEDSDAKKMARGRTQKQNSHHA
ncbi:cysteine desulfurase [Bacillus sp. H-16]|uniref:IscS subfamily cysteine desulfurase n=1 Tax=Alteribacter salitolerans TaxID=2912333 RepID=UPI001963604F|nr:cysteine desulfurase [Alteribacter salitolerans]